MTGILRIAGSRGLGPGETLAQTEKWYDVVRAVQMEGQWRDQ